MVRLCGSRLCGGFIDRFDSILFSNLDSLTVITDDLLRIVAERRSCLGAVLSPSLGTALSAALGTALGTALSAALLDDALLDVIRSSLFGGLIGNGLAAVYTGYCNYKSK